MRMVDIIEKKRDGGVLTEEEIRFFVEGYTHDEIPDYQASAFAMAIYFKGMNKHEIAILTDAMEHSGDVVDLSSIPGVKVDKHSTGGVGDKTSMALGPLVAACGAKFAKMSGRGLGHTGGTLDKLESIPGMTIQIEKERFLKQVKDIGIAIIGQSGNITPADKKLYALRDVTGTIESIPMIASSIMSKKLAAGSDAILLDVKFGSGAFMKTLEDARNLAKHMVEIGDSLNRDTRAILTDMDQPLGLAVGNALEVKEAIDTLNGKGPRDFVELVVKAGAISLEQAKLAKNREEGEEMIKKAIDDRSGLAKLRAMVEAQGGDPTYIDHPEKFPLAKHIVALIAKESGYVERIDSMAIGVGAMKLGAGRATMEDKIDMAAGIVLNKKVGDEVEEGDILLQYHTNLDLSEKERKAIEKSLSEAFEIAEDKVEVHPIIHDYIK
ncbi:MAG: pyrimidine-nucleoside phosphorylase [Bacilli bacterium]|nr:pyrimidine-nucleoside phosphorylase [Bacilli bacterium]